MHHQWRDKSGYIKTWRDSPENNFRGLLSVRPFLKTHCQSSSNGFPDCLNRSDYDRQLLEAINPYSGEDVASNGYDSGYGADSQDAQFQHPCLELKRILGNSGSFYYSVDHDLTNRLQDRQVYQFLFPR